MPVRPEHRHHYRGPAWQTFRASILARASNACECTGECGDAHGHPAFRNVCSAPNGSFILREDANPAAWALFDDVGKWISCDPFGKAERVKVILTIAHLNHQEGDDRVANVKAMCQRCHLRLDRHQHATNAARTRRGRSRQQQLPGTE